MKVTVRKVALVAVSAGLVACSVETGEVIVNVTCEDEGCGHEGILRSHVEDCDEDTASYGENEVRVTLTTASTFAFSFDNVLDGGRCVQAYLDVDTNGELSAGDVISSEAVMQGVAEEDDDEDQELDDDPEINVEVVTDETAIVDVELDTVVPPEI